RYARRSRCRCSSYLPLGGSGADQPLGPETVDDALHRLVDTLDVAPDMQLRLAGRLVRSADPGELPDLAACGAGVESLRITFAAGLEGRIHVDLEEPPDRE